MLTPKQHELLLFIDQYLKRTGCSPSFEDMKTALGLKSKSGVHRLISALEERRFLTRRHQRARALEVLRLPGQPVVAVVPAAPPPPPPVKTRGASLEIPLYGRIAAGAPIEALCDGGDRVDVPLSLLGNGGAYYVLEVAGDSMMEAGILDGDWAVIQEGAQAEEGTIVVALIDEREATLKKIRRKGHMVALEPANPRYETRLLPASRVRVQGKLIALMRRY